MQTQNFTEISAASESEVKNLAALSEGAYKILVPYSAISFGGEKYNEAYLAALRDALKAAENANSRFVIAPAAEKNAFSSIDSALELTAAYKHCARRLKDCENLIGFEVPKEFAQMERGVELAENFITEFLEKHPKYVFAAEKAFYEKIRDIGDFAMFAI